jgi:DNA-binding XRE family transcriptional regulator
VSDVSASAAQSFGKQIAHYRARAGITQEELGHLSSIHWTEIGLLENGQPSRAWTRSSRSPAPSASTPAS